MNRPFAVIFDMDGVLVDSYHAHARSWQVMTAKWGHAMTTAQFNATFGQTSREIIAKLWPEAGYTDAEIAAMDADKEAAFREVLAVSAYQDQGAAGSVSQGSASWGVGGHGDGARR